MRPPAPDCRLESGPRPLTAEDVAAFVHVAEDADGAPLPDELRAFFADVVDDVLRFDGCRLVVLGIAGPSYYPPVRVRAAIEDARRVWRTIRPARARPVHAEHTLPPMSSSR